MPQRTEITQFISGQPLSGGISSGRDCFATLAMTIGAGHCEAPPSPRVARPEDKLRDEATSGLHASLVIIVHSLDHAIAALTAAARAERPTILASAPDAGGYVGPGWFAALTAAAREAAPEAQFSAWLDCGDNAGAALAAIRAGVEGIIFTGRADVARRLIDVARQHGVWFETSRPAGALDLGEDFFAAPQDVERRCEQFLANELPGAPFPRARRCRPSSFPR